ncbi:MAG: M3 family metallopeptidase [Firmicutes bacterium]|nr:M3 family metallopeptidase [Bacillota bacterium]
MLLNWQGNLNSVFTLAHELGHSMHSWYSHQNQPYIYGEYEIFVAEVASTVNENLLLRYLLNREQDPAQRLLLVNHYLDDFRGTVFRQTMFAEFEKIIHAAAEAGEALSCKYFQDTYYQLNLDYFGPDMEVDQEIDMEWSRIPHFYRAFYVYKYATGMSAATALAQGILSGDARKVKDYISFLSGGCSQSPLQLLRGAGVDMDAGGRQTLNSAMQVFADMLDELERLLNEMH